MSHCSFSCQVVYTDVYMLDDEMKWKTLPPMPKPNSHIEFAWALVNNSIVIVGGTTEKHPVTKKMVLNGEVIQFNLNTLVTISLFQSAGKWVSIFAYFFIFNHHMNLHHHTHITQLHVRMLINTLPGPIYKKPFSESYLSLFISSLCNCLIHSLLFS